MAKDPLKSTKTIKEALDSFLEQYKLKERLKGSEVKETWSDVMGKTINSRTEELWLKEKKLVVRISSGPLKHHLLTNRSKIISLLNEALGQDAIDEVVIL